MNDTQIDENDPDTTPETDTDPDTDTTPDPDTPQPGKTTAAGQYHSCAIKSGDVYCWGANSFGQLGDGTNDDKLKATLVPGVNDAVDIAAGDWHSCARLKWHGHVLGVKRSPTAW